MNVIKYFRKQSRTFITVSSFVLVIIIGIFDYLTGPVFSSLLAYLIPVIFATRFAGRTAGILMSVSSSLVWIAADIMAGQKHTFLIVHFWNLFEKLGIFLVVVFVLLKIARIEEERKNMLSMLAHDMKNPALVAKGFSSRLLRGKAGELTESQADYVGLINDELSRLERLILNFLDMSRLEAKEFKLSPVPLDISLHIKKHVEAVRIEADKKNISIFMDCPDKGVPPVYVDAVQFDRVIRNLIGNAIKYTDSGGSITLTLSVKSRFVVVQVKDTGRGIPEEHIKHVFEPYHRVANDSSGIGLGLPIVKSIVKAHGGRIWVESKPGKGTEFGLTLPRYRGDGA